MSSRVAASSTASLIAMPRLPVLSGSASRIAAPGVRVRRRARHDLAAPGADHRAPVRLLVVGGAHHVDLALEAEQLAGECQRRAPLAGAGLGGEPRDALLAVVEGLRHRRVRLVAARGADALVLVEDPAGRAERLLQAEGAVQRGGPPHRVDLAHGVGDRDPAVAADLLQDQRHREERRQVVRARPAGRCRGAAGAAAATAGRPRRCTTDGGSRPRRGCSAAGPPGASFRRGYAGPEPTLARRGAATRARAARG